MIPIEAPLQWDSPPPAPDPDTPEARTDPEALLARPDLADSLLARWRARMLEVTFAPSGRTVSQLARSYTYQGGVMRIALSTAEHSKFVDWGVGRGRPLKRHGRYTYRDPWRQIFYSLHTHEDISWLRLQMLHTLRRAVKATLREVEALGNGRTP